MRFLLPALAALLALADPTPRPEADASSAKEPGKPQPKLAREAEAAGEGSEQRQALPRYELSFQPLALAPADLDGDGKDELLVLGREALLALRPAGERFERYARLGLESRVRRRNGIARVPTGGLAAADLDGDGRQEVALMTSDLQAGSIVYWTGLRFHEVGTIEDLPFGLASIDGVPTFFFGSLQPGTSRLGTGYLRPVQREEREPQDRATPSLALAAQRNLEHLAALTPEGELVVWGGDGVIVGRVPDAGSALALAELDRDEVLPELILTDPALAHAPDRVRVLTLGGEHRTLWDSGPVKGEVVAVTAGAFRGKGQHSVVFTVVPHDGGETELREVSW